MTQNRFLLDRSGVDALIAALAARGHRVVGPTVADGAIVYDDVASTADMPVGWTDEQDAGHYRLRRRDDDALFGYAVGPQSWKRYLYPPRQRLWSATRNGDAPEIASEPADEQPFALFGVRPCEIAAMHIQDQVLTGGEYPDPSYADRYGRAFVVAAHCTAGSGTCFCASMGTGPHAQEGFDLALTELLEPGRHVFLVEIGTPRGAALLETLENTPPATDSDHAAADEAIARAEAHMGRTLNTEGIVELLERNIESPVWNEVAQRCLACANCTNVCPTCFCTTVEDTTDLTGEHAERWRRWDSCYNRDFSFIAGSLIRHSTKSRYRQWMTHKLSAWHRQFGTSGCVGCGRCITWCPVGIDITEEAETLRTHERTASTFYTATTRDR